MTNQGARLARALFLDSPMSKIAFGSTPILPPTAAPGVGAVVIVEPAARAFQATVVGASAQAVVAIEVSVDGKAFLELAQIELDAAAGQASDGFVSSAPWRHVRASVLSISGGTVTVHLGV